MNSYLKFILYTLVFFLISSEKINAQEIISDSLAKKEKEFSIPSLVKEFFNDGGKIYSRPFRLKEKELQIIFPAATLTGILLLSDHEINNEVVRMKAKNNWLHDTGNAISNGGEPVFTLGVAATFLAGGLLFDNHRAKETGLMAGQAIVHTAIATTVLKTLFGRERPTDNYGEGNFRFTKESLKNWKDNSFPSGHSSTAWALAAVIGTEYRDNKWIPVVAYSSAGLVSLSRVVLQKHWSADVFTGGLLGYAIGRLIVKEHQKKWSVLPYSSSNGTMGIHISTQF